ncbi:AfsR family transcriptional regulator [Gordonia oryzae]|uniref:AfsR family transcriptional regulator n=1 Tax=Gordonia oryzae TaxID=2487349 RepID=A0A3N4G5T0_9ACTN|nr:BTAD domain-containing putative transcriptional regulator [Gordonia oryzae]RPA57458.1 AfsR family transcriptional regulator [Gordonia oryzae]
MTEAPRTHPRIGVLGPVCVFTTASEATPVTSGRARSLLVSLVLSHPRPVGIEALVADAWPDRPPQNPNGAVQTQISRLRKSLGAQMIAGSAAGYRLVTDGPVSDLAVVEDLSRSARSAELEYPTGLQNWRGEPGTDLPDGELRARLTARADRAFRILQEADWRRRLRTEPQTVATELAMARERRPLDEHLAAVHMRAVLAAGDPNAALQIHARIAAGLAEALGADPGPELAAAHSAALTYAPMPRTPPPPSDEYLADPEMMTQLTAALRESSVVTVLGPGGIGKTRLVTEYIAVHTPMNVFVDLSAARAPDDVRAAVAAALGRGALPEQGTAATPTASPVSASGIAGAALAHLAAAGAVIVLDGCEHLVDFVADLITDIRSRRDDLTIVATSRIGLGLVDERNLTVPPLPPERGAALLERRIRALRPEIQTDVAVFAELCTRLDGSPLAIELAAAQLRHLSPRDLLERVDSRFELLTPTGGRRRSLSEIVSTSWELLPDNAQRTLEVLASLPGDVRLDDALTFAEVTEQSLAEVCNHSLAVVVDHPDGATRYRLTETVREFARAHTAADPAREAALRREKIAWASRLVTDVAGTLSGTDVVKAFARLDETTDAVLAILDSVVGDPDPADPGAPARLLPITLWRVVRTGGHPGLGDLAEAAVSGCDDPGCGDSAEIPGLLCATGYLIALGRYRAAGRARTALRRTARRHPPAAHLAPLVEAVNGSPRRLAQVLARASRSANPVVAAVAEIARSDIAEFAAAPSMSRRSALRAVVAAELAGHPWLTAAARHRLGRGHLLLGDRAGAATLFARAADDYAALGFQEESSRTRVHQAIALSDSAPDVAVELLETCLRDSGDTPRAFVATAHAALADLRVGDDPSGARRSAERAIEIVGPPTDAHCAYLHGVRAVILARTGEMVAARLAAESLRISLSRLAAAPAANLPALGAASAAVSLVTGTAPTDVLAGAARGARYRRDFSVIDLGDGPHSRRTALLTVLR